MAEPVLHYVIPVLLLLFLFPKIPKRTILLMGLLVFVPDLDFFVKDMHGILLHNVFLVLIVALIFYFALGKTYAWISAYFTMSHLLFDLDYGRPIFWPVYKMAIALHIWIEASPLKPFFDIEIFDLVKLREPYQPYYLQNAGALIVLFIVFMIILVYWKKELKYKK